MCVSDPPLCLLNYFLSSQGVSISSLSLSPAVYLALPSFLSAVYLVNLIRSSENPGDSLTHIKTHSFTGNVFRELVNLIENTHMSVCACVLENEEALKMINRRKFSKPYRIAKLICVKQAVLEAW